MRKMFESIKQIKIKEYKNFLIYFLVVFVSLFAIDQITKYVAEALLVEGKTVVFIPNFIEFVLVYNTGAAWGVGGDAMWSRVILTSLSWVVLIFLICYIIQSMTKNKKFHPFFGVALSLVLAGDLGNLIDRTFFFNRGVIDFISIQSWWPNFGIFNIADSCLVVGLFMIIIWLIVEEVKDQIRQKNENEKKIAEAKKLDEENKKVELNQNLENSNNENKDNEDAK